MESVTLYRKSNFMLMARKFKIYIDNNRFGDISDGEQKIIEIPAESNQLTVKVMNYVSKPITMKDSETYEISQSIISVVTTFLMIISVGIYMFTKYLAKNEQPMFLYIAAPFVLISLYYSTFGRKNVIQVKIKDSL